MTHVLQNQQEDHGPTTVEEHMALTDIIVIMRQQLTCLHIYLYLFTNIRTYIHTYIYVHYEGLHYSCKHKHAT